MPKKPAKRPRRQSSTRRRGPKKTPLSSAKKRSSRDRWILISVGLAALAAVGLAAWLGGGFFKGGSLSSHKVARTIPKSAPKSSSGAASQGGQTQVKSKIPVKGAQGKVSGSRAGKASTASQSPSATPPSASPAKQPPDVMDALVMAVNQAELDAAQIRIGPNQDAAAGVVVLVLDLPKNSKPNTIKKAVQAYLNKAGLQAKWSVRKNALVMDLGANQQVSHRLVFRMPSGSAQTKQAKAATQKTPAPKPAAKPGGQLPRLAIVIDDMGQAVEPAKQLLALDMNLTFSILPNGAQAAKVAELINRAGYSIMVHLPMQPKPNTNGRPGKDALHLNMTTQEIIRLTRQHLAAIPGAKGMNNHMGSAFTENANAMLPVLEILQEHDMFFLDSVTTPKTKGLSVARKLGIPSGRRDVFLDYDKNGKVVAKQLKQALLMAKQQGYAIAIAHPYPATIQALKRAKPMLKSMVEIVDVQSLMTKPR